MNHLENFYSTYDEEARFGYRHNSVEFLTTMRYIQKYLQKGARILEIGAGTGRYCRAIADLGYTVDAVELVSHNIDVFRSLITPAQNISVVQGNALDLHMHDDSIFDITLMFGPMYHLYNYEDKHRAISEALRVTKPGGLLFVAYCISDASLLEDGFFHAAPWFEEYMEKGFIDPVTFDTTSLPEMVFELVRKDDIDRLMAEFPVQRLHYVATDMISRIIRDGLANMSDKQFEMYLQYHFAVCERPDMVGVTHHSLDVFKKVN